MQKTLSDLAKYLKNLIPAAIPEEYMIRPELRSITNEKKIQQGVIAYRNFLFRFCDYLVDNGDKYDKPKKVAHEFSERVSLQTNYPFLHNIINLLLNIGIHGELCESDGSLKISGDQLRAALVKISNQNIIEGLRCLLDNGFSISGIDLSKKEVDLSSVVSLEVLYPENPTMLTGLKIMAMAQEMFHARNTYDIFLRCDYRVLADQMIDTVYYLADMIRPFPAENQKFVLNLHRHCMDRDFTCFVDVKGLCLRFVYSYKKREIWSIILSSVVGYDLAIRAKHIDKYADIIEKFPAYLQEIIAKGYGCNKKKDRSSYCQGGCKGYRISLSKSILDISQDIVNWIDKEYPEK